MCYPPHPLPCSAPDVVRRAATTTTPPHLPTYFFLLSAIVRRHGVLLPGALPIFPIGLFYLQPLTHLILHCRCSVSGVDVLDAPFSCPARTTCQLPYIWFPTRCVYPTRPQRACSRRAPAWPPAPPSSRRLRLPARAVLFPTTYVCPRAAYVPAYLHRARRRSAVCLQLPPSTHPTDGGRPAAGADHFPGVLPNVDAPAPPTIFLFCIRRSTDICCCTVLRGHRRVRAALFLTAVLFLPTRISPPVVPFARGRRLPRRISTFVLPAQYSVACVFGRPPAFPACTFPPALQLLSPRPSPASTCLPVPVRGLPDRCCPCCSPHLPFARCAPGLPTFLRCSHRSSCCVRSHDMVLHLPFARVRPHLLYTPCIPAPPTGGGVM